MEIKVLKDILSTNNQLAAQNRRLLAARKIMAINLMSSPGAGKTTLIMATARALQGKARVGVIEGDVSSSLDTEKLITAGITAVQINTGGECHLDAGMVQSALANLPLDNIDVIFIENVGNLICPGGFALGEHLKVVLTSTPEGDDKPHKYPLLFTIADACVVTKNDLLPYVNFALDSFTQAVKGMNQKVVLFPVTAPSGEGISEWAAWIMEKLDQLRHQAEK